MCIFPFYYFITCNLQLSTLHFIPHTFQVNSLNSEFNKILKRENSIGYYHFLYLIAGSLEAAYSLNWGAQEIWGKGGGETLALL